MGLDVSYFTNLVRLSDIPDDGEPGEDLAIYPSIDFPAQADELQRGLYAIGECDGFYAGSYGAYNRWRKKLANIAGYTPNDAWLGALPAGTPFLQLVNFSDCDGVFGPETSARLASDFAAFRDQAAATGDDWFIGLFTKFETAFQVAATNNGAVIFH